MLRVPWMLVAAVVAAFVGSAFMEDGRPAAHRRGWALLTVAVLLMVAQVGVHGVA